MVDSNPPNIEPRPAARALRWTLLALGWLLLGIVLLLMTLWAGGALYFDAHVPWLRVPLAVGYLLAVAATWIVARRRRVVLAIATTAGALLLVTVLWGP